MRSYRQYCGLARALDVVGDRWSLLIVRELLILGPSRYSDLLDGLPGIATNMLAERLRELEEAGVIERLEPHPPVATRLVQLTERGEALAPVVKALGAWAGPLLGEWEPGVAFRTHWLVLPLELRLVDLTPAAPPVVIEVRTGDSPITIEAGRGMVRVRPGSARRPDVIVSGPPDAVLAALLGRVSLGSARRRGLRIEGNVAVLDRVRPADDATVRRR